MAQSSRKSSNGPGRGTPRARANSRSGSKSERGKIHDTGRIDIPKSDQAVQTPSNRRFSFGATWRLILLGVVIAALVLALAQSLRVYFAQASDIAQLRAEIEQSQADIAELEDQLERWDDPEYVKVQARERLGWVLPGETGYRVVGADGETLGGDSSVLAEEEAQGMWWERMWGSVAKADEPVAEPTTTSTPTGTIGPTPEPTEN